MISRSHDFGAELRMHFFSVDCDTLTGSEAMLALIYSTLLVKFLMKRLEGQH